MDEWTPVLALPNLDMRGTLECPYAAIVAPTDPRVEKLRATHPKLTTFLSKFSGQFREQVWPSLLLLRADAPQSYYTAEAVSAFRDILSLSVVPFPGPRGCALIARTGSPSPTPSNFIRGCSTSSSRTSS
jgi:hypothetical protein